MLVIGHFVISSPRGVSYARKKTMAKVVATAKKVAKKSVFTILQESAEQLKAKGGQRRMLIGLSLLTLSVIAFFTLPVVGISTAMLYLIADNGKKSGRADGNVYMRNGRIRGFKVPAYVSNAYTSIARTNLSGLSSAWNALTDAQRSSWINVDFIFKSNRFGQPVAVRGKELFVSCNTNLLNAGQAIISTFITDAVSIALTSFSGSGATGAGTMLINFTATPLPAGMNLLLYATAPQRAGIYRPSQSKYRLIDALPPATASGASIQAAYLAKFGQPVAGDKVFIRAVIVNSLNGRASAQSDASFIQAA